MPEGDNLKKHIVFAGRVTPEKYTSPAAGGSSFVIVQRNPSEHGQEIRAKLEAIREQSQAAAETAPAPFIQEDVVYLDFISAFDVELAFDSFEDNRSGNYHLLSTSKEENQYRALVAVNSKGLSKFIKLVEAYATQVTAGDKPRNAKLISNISDIRIATLRSFWNEPTLPFPADQDEIWWEIWFRRNRVDQDVHEDDKVVTQLTTSGANVSTRRLLMPEHIVRLVKGTPVQLSTSLLLLDNLAELRKAKNTADFFTDLRNFEQQEWVNDLLSRIENQGNNSPVFITLLDSGVNNGHPLLAQFLPNTNMDSYNAAWGNLDGHPHGHGTQMAGLAVYGDLTEVMASPDSIRIAHRLESIKMINPSAPHQPDLYGQVTLECVNRAIVLGADRKRVFCMAVTAEDNRDRGKPSSWSSSVDKIAFGDTGISDDKNLILVSVGNVFHDNYLEYPNKNKTEFVHDPAQAFNVLTIGAYTEKDSIDTARFPNANPLAQRGSIAPCSSTSCLSDHHWPIKPDVVMEGGNYAVQNGSLICPPSLQLLTTAKDFTVSHFADFGDTSGATALGSNLAAKIMSDYPNLLPETIRGIIIHSANWTPAMLGGTSIGQLSMDAKKDVLRTFGYGVPNLNKALYSLRNSLTLIAERDIQPFRLDGSVVKTNQLHLFDLPWPEDALLDLGENDVKLTITLSYFIEPNPGSRYFSSKFNYQSHGLRFEVKRPLETLQEFRARINREARQERYDPGVSQSDKWQIGKRLRNVGSVHKDIWLGTGAELAAMKNIAVYPVNGWWRLRKKLGKYQERVRYSLIVTIETDVATADLYTPVENMIAVTV
jgi:hypothetical protein